MTNKFNFHVFKELIKSDLIVFKESFWDKFVDLTIWVILTLVVMGYIMPQMGLYSDYGVFQLAALLASAGLFEVYPAVVNFISDLEGDNSIAYYLTLPVSSGVIFFSKVMYYALNSFVLSILMLPIGKLALFDLFDLSTIAWFKFLLISLSSSFFYGTFTLWTTSMVKDMSKVGSVWMRFIFPIWFLGGFNFSYDTLLKISPKLAYLNLLNPMIYITEGYRVTILGQENYINFWICLGVILSFSIIGFLHAFERLKRRLDLV